jgi:hypothetical protein
MVNGATASNVRFFVFFGESFQQKNSDCVADKKCGCQRQAAHFIVPGSADPWL